MPWIYIQAEYVVAAAEILDERVASSDHSCRTESFEAAHRPEPSLQAAMVGFYGVVGVLLGDMARRGQQFIEHSWVGRRLIGADFGRTWGVLEGPGEEAAGGGQIACPGDQDVDDLAVLVDCPV